LKTFGPFKQMSAYLHVLYVHGADYLKWAEETVGAPLGAISEAAIEAHNKLAKYFRKKHARMDSVEHQSDDVMLAKLVYSDPYIISYFEVVQTIKRGAIRKSKK
jgi:hypothetical protein